MNGPVQLGLSLLQRLQRAIFLQRDHNRFDVTSADDHLVISNLVAEGNGTLTHTRSIPRQLGAMADARHAVVMAGLATMKRLLRQLLHGQSAYRWENTAEGTKGWPPERRPGTTRDNPEYLPLTDEVILADPFPNDDPLPGAYELRLPADAVTIWYTVSVHEGREGISVQHVGLDT